MRLPHEVETVEQMRARYGVAREPLYDQLAAEGVPALVRGGVMESIRVTIKNGAVKIETSGFSGPGCQKATEKLSKALGKSVKDTPTSEFYEIPVSHEITNK